MMANISWLLDKEDEAHRPKMAMEIEIMEVQLMDQDPHLKQSPLINLPPGLKYYGERLITFTWGRKREIKEEEVALFVAPTLIPKISCRLTTRMGISYQQRNRPARRSSQQYQDRESEDCSRRENCMV